MGAAFCAYVKKTYTKKKKKNNKCCKIVEKLHTNFGNTIK